MGLVLGAINVVWFYGLTTKPWKKWFIIISLLNEEVFALMLGIILMRTSILHMHTSIMRMYTNIMHIMYASIIHIQTSIMRMYRNIMHM